MPIDTPEASAAPTTRRAFLTRAALGGAVVTAGAVAGPFGRLVPLAGAQDGGSGGDPIDDVALLEFAGPLEKAAVLAYQAAIDNGSLDEDWTELARQFQSNHRDAAEALTANAGEVEEEPAPSQELMTRFVAPLEGADEPTTLRTLSEMEDLIATSHLAALVSIPDPVSSKAVAQVLAVESQQAVLLGRAAGIALDELTPAVASSEGGLEPSESTSGSSGTTTTTTTAAGSGGDGEGSSDAGTGSSSGSGDAATTTTTAD